MPHPLRIRDEGDTARLGIALADALGPGDAVLLDGPLGAGKTALVRALLRRACRDPALAVPSPSYTLLQLYDAAAGFPIAHLDLWRLGGPDELAELGWRDLRAGAVLVEWPDRLGPYRPPAALTVALAPDPADDDARDAVLDGWPDHRLAPVLAHAAASDPLGAR